ncbi:hypothetical protein BGW80DRAFT_1324423 [Lactifluus volemus]|nr:hypothetical protein BGW80DRAFT_1355484 [Lactifluus volemus]KAH9971161.1 hypothetical protein BGW80DRAFT_1324423 [Lactifluus volemus]
MSQQRRSLTKYWARTRQATKSLVPSRTPRIRQVILVKGHRSPTAFFLVEHSLRHGEDLSDNSYLFSFFFRAVYYTPLVYEGSCGHSFRFGFGIASLRSPDLRIFGQMLALSSDVGQRAGVRLCTGIAPANLRTRRKKLGWDCQVRFQVSIQRNRCLLFVPNDQAPSRSGLPAVA